MATLHRLNGTKLSLYFLLIAILWQSTLGFPIRNDQKSIGITKKTLVPTVKIPLKADELSVIHSSQVASTAKKAATVKKTPVKVLSDIDAYVTKILKENQFVTLSQKGCASCEKTRAKLDAANIAYHKIDTMSKGKTTSVSEFASLQ